jgi:hypothetical protein
MDSYIVAEDPPDEAASADLEMAEIAKRKPFLNEKSGSAFYSRAAPGQRTTPHRPQWAAVRSMRKKGHFTPNALQRRAGRALFSNPKKA